MQRTKLLMSRIPIYSLQENFQSAVYSSGKWIDGEKMIELENKLKEYLDIPYIILTNSGTSALLAAYWALKKEYSSLTTDPFTFPATYQTAKVIGYQVNFSRWVLKDSIQLNNDLTALVHLFGQPSKHLSQVPINNLIEDCAQAFGAEYQGKKVGTFGRVGILSFYPTKTLHTCGQGGAVITKDQELYEEMKSFVECGRANGKMTDTPALNLKLDEIKAEFLIEALSKYNERIEIQREIAHEFKHLVAGYQPFLSEDLTNGEKHIYSVFNILVDDRKAFQARFEDLGIETMIYYNQDILPQNERSKYTDITGHVVSIPCRWNLTKEEILRIKSGLKEL